jgi:hypothetical protein
MRPSGLIHSQGSMGRNPEGAAPLNQASSCFCKAKGGTMFLQLPRASCQTCLSQLEPTITGTYHGIHQFGVHLVPCRMQHSGWIMRASSGISTAPLLSLVAAPGRPGGGQGPGWWGGGGGGGGDAAAAGPSGGAGAGQQAPVVLTLASFAVTKLAYVRLTKQFREMYLQRTGVDVRFRLTFAGSGVQVSGCPRSSSTPG